VNRFIPPKPGGSETLFLGSDSANDASISDAVLPRGPIVALNLGGDSVFGAPILDALFPPERDRKIARTVANNPVFRFGAGFSFSGSRSEDICRLFILRCRSRFDLTLPIQETFGDDGSTSGASDLLTDPDRFGGNNQVFPGLPFRRFFASTKQDF
jgi:hypothetical protein